MRAGLGDRARRQHRRHLLLIPPLGIMGAAVASTMSYTLNAAMLLTIASRLSRRRPLDLVPPTRAERDGCAMGWTTSAAWLGGPDRCGAC